MKRLSAILLLLLLLTTTEAEQLLRLPFLVRHYITHSEASGNLGFADFLALHYGDAATNNNDPEDNRLPFKFADPHHLGFVYLGQAPLRFTAPGEKLWVSPDRELPRRYLPGYPTGIFRPPAL